MIKEGPNLATVKIVIIDGGKGNKQYCKNKGRDRLDLILHREDGPAIEYANTYKAHFKDGLKHGVVEFAGRVCSTWEKGVRV